MRFFSVLVILLASIGCESASKYKSELVNYPNLSPHRVDGFEVYDIKERNLQLSLNFQSKKLYLKITNNSEEKMSFLPLDVNLGTADNRCTIKEIYEDFIWQKSDGKKINFATKYTLETKMTKDFYYKFDCKKSPEAFLTINGLKQNNKIIILNFKFSEN